MGRRWILAEAHTFDQKRLVYHASHSSATPHNLYTWRGQESLWWKALDWCRDRWPGWFLPNEFVVKVLDNDREDRAYAKLKPIQGRGVPRYYGLTTFQKQPALVLECIHGRLFGDVVEPYRETIKKEKAKLKECQNKLQKDQEDWVTQQSNFSYIYRESPTLKSNEQAAKKAVKAQCEDNSRNAQTLISSVKALASKLSSLGVANDFNSSNIICCQEGDIWIIDFEDTHKDETTETARVENEGGLDGLLFDNGFSSPESASAEARIGGRL